MNNRRGLLILTAAAGIALSGCATNPVTGQSEIAFTSEAEEIQMGQESYLPGRQQEGGDYTLDPALSSYVNGVGQKLAAVADRKLPYEFVVLNNSVPNAWALPGGKIALNRGLLTELNSEAELAAVLGHEIVHAAARHGAHSQERSVLMGLGLLIAAIALADKDYGALAVGGAAVGTAALGQKYSRDNEREADYYGMQYMARAGYDPRAAIKLQETFVRLAEGRNPGWLEGLFASHPPSQERVEANRETAKALPAGGETSVERYRRMIAPLKKVEPAYAAYDQGRKALAKDDYAKALALADKAIAIEPREGHFHELRADALLGQRNVNGAVAEYGRSISLNGKYFYPYLMRGMIREQLGDKAGARSDLLASYKLLPTEPAQKALNRLGVR